MIITLNDDEREIQVEFLDVSLCPGIDPESPLVELIHLCERFNSFVPLKNLKFWRPGPALDEYKYKFEAKDDRKWNQDIKFLEQVDKDPGMTFSTGTDYWKLSEFEYHRAVRIQIVTLRADYKLDKVDIVWA